MPSKSRGGLSKREYATLSGTTGSTKAIKGNKTTKRSPDRSINKEYKSLAKAQKEYLGALKPSKEEEVALGEQNRILTEHETTAQKIQNVQGDKGNVVAAPFIERQLDRLGADTEAKTVPLKYQIAALQSNREAKAKFATAKYNTIAKNISSKTKEVKEENPLDVEYKQLRNERAKVSLNKALKRGKGGGTSKSFSNALAQSQKSILKGLSDRETEQQYLKTRFGKDLDVQDILRDGYQVKKKSKSGK